MITVDITELRDSSQAGIPAHYVEACTIGFRKARSAGQAGDLQVLIWGVPEFRFVNLAERPEHVYVQPIPKKAQRMHP